MFVLFVWFCQFAKLVKLDSMPNVVEIAWNVLFLALQKGLSSTAGCDDTFIWHFKTLQTFCLPGLFYWPVDESVSCVSSEGVMWVGDEFKVPIQVCNLDLLWSWTYITNCEIFVYRIQTYWFDASLWCLNITIVPVDHAQIFRRCSLVVAFDLEK